MFQKSANGDYAIRIDAIGTSGIHTGPWMIIQSFHCPSGFTGGGYNEGGNSIQYCEALLPTDECPNCQAQLRSNVGNPVNVATRNKTQVEVDYSATQGVPAFGVARTYQSLRRKFEFAFSGHSLVNLLDSSSSLRGCYLSTANVSQESERVPYCFPIFRPIGVASSVRVMRPGGRTDTFLDSTLQPSTAQTNGSIVRTPDGFRVTNFQQNTFEEYDGLGRIRAIVAAGGLRSSFSYAAQGDVTVESSFGRTLVHRMNDLGNVASVTLPDGSEIKYTYARRFQGAPRNWCTSDACERLVAVEYPDGTTRQYLYDETAKIQSPTARGGLLTGVVDEKDVRFASFFYAGDTPVRTEHAGETNAFAVTYPTSVRAVVTDPLGGTRTYNFKTVAGVVDVTSVTGGHCPTCVNTQTLDARGNVASRTDFNNALSCFAYEATRNREAVRVEGLASGASCTVTGANATLPAGSRKTSTQWHPDWQFQVSVAEPGRRVTSVYNGQPDPFNGNAIASCAPGTALLPDGKPIAVLCKRVEQATTDTNGAAGFNAALQAGVAAREWKWTYNEHGQVLTEDGPRTDVSDVTTYEYHADTTTDHTKGDLKKVTNPAGQTTRYTKYNPHGQVLESLDVNNVLTVNTYDLRQRLLSTTVGTQTTGYEYDLAGQLKRVTLPDGSWTGYDHDDAHRLVAVYDHKGNRTDYVLDNAGNRTAESTRDPNGSLKRQLGRTLDALGRVQQTTGRE